MPKKAVRIFLFICILFICLAVIFLFGIQNGTDSNELSGTMAQRLINLIAKKRGITLRANEITRIYHLGDELLRLAAHFIMFASFGMAFGTGFLILRWSRPKPLDYLHVFLIGSLVGLMSEALQLFVEGRQCDMLDFLFDVAGVFMGIVFIYTFIGFFSWLFIGRHSSSKTENSNGLNDNASAVPEEAVNESVE